MSEYLEQIRENLRVPLRVAIEKIRPYLLHPEFTERMKEIFSLWRVEPVREEISSYNDTHTVGFGIPVRIGQRTNDEINFMFRVKVTGLKKAREGHHHQYILDFWAARSDINRENHPVRITLGASVSPDIIKEMLSKTKVNKLLNQGCSLLFNEDFIRLDAGLPPRS